jgi:hypothetical protein
VTYWKLMKIPRWSMGAIGAFISYFVMTFYEPILAIRLADFNLTTQQIGFMFMVMPIC